VIFVHAKARRREEGVSLGMPSGALDTVFVRAEARRRGDCVAGGVLLSRIADRDETALTRAKQRGAAGAITSSSLRVFAPSRDTIQRAAA
jgi:hypothetical protein